MRGGEVDEGVDISILQDLGEILVVEVKEIEEVKIVLPFGIIDARVDVLKLLELDGEFGGGDVEVDAMIDLLFRDILEHELRNIGEMFRAMGLLPLSAEPSDDFDFP